MSELIIPGHQPMFPYEDIDQRSANTYVNWLTIKDHIMTHPLVEDNSQLYKLGHSVVEKIIAHTGVVSPLQQSSISEGFAFFEVLSACVRPKVPKSHTNRDVTDDAIINAFEVFCNEPYARAAYATSSDFRDQMPHTAEAIERKAADFFTPANVGSAVVGAAMAWKLETTARPDSV